MHSAIQLGGMKIISFKIVILNLSGLVGGVGGVIEDFTTSFTFYFFAAVKILNYIFSLLLAGGLSSAGELRRGHRKSEDCDEF